MSMPIIAAAVVLKGREVLQHGGVTPEVIAGVLAAAISSWLAITILLRYVSRHSYGIFALYRVILGVAVLVFLQMRG
jgi:undecaprenyl-diphosphatase